MRIRAIAFSSKGCELAARLCRLLSRDGEDCSAYSRTTGERHGTRNVRLLKKWTEDSFKECDAILFVGAAGIAVRQIAPLLTSKAEDPAVIVIDELGKHVIPILSGHIGGGNRLAVRIAKMIDSVPVITTATDLNNVFSVDTYATEKGMHMNRLTAAKNISARLLDGRPVFFRSDFPVEGTLPAGLSFDLGGDAGIYVSSTMDTDPFGSVLKLVPKHNILGIGCRRGTPMKDIEDHVTGVLRRNNVSIYSIRAVGSIDIKKDETGLIEFAEKYGLPIIFFTKEQLESVPGEFTDSETVMRNVGIGNVCERAALAASDDGTLVIRKDAANSVTVAVASEKYTVKFGDGTS
jgi:cobalt-precorrin 5A hydrolase